MSETTRRPNVHYASDCLTRAEWDAMASVPEHPSILSTIVSANALPMGTEVEWKSGAAYITLVHDQRTEDGRIVSRLVVPQRTLRSRINGIACTIDVAR